MTYDGDINRTTWSRQPTSAITAITLEEYRRHNDTAPRGPKESYVNVGELTPPRPPWHEQAACRGVVTDGTKGPHPFFPEVGASPAKGLRWCRDCTVTAECAAYAESMDAAPKGIWGGVPEVRRKEARVTARLAAAGRPTVCGTCDERPVRYPNSGECGPCYEKRVHRSTVVPIDARSRRNHPTGRAS